MKDYRFSLPLRVRVGDLNYGAHVGYQHFFSYFQEARIAYLDQWHYSEFNIDGTGIIVAEANCRYRQELFLGDTIEVGCRVSELKSKRFTFLYRVERDGKICAEGFTHNLCFDYEGRKVVKLPKPFVNAVAEFESL